MPLISNEEVEFLLKEIRKLRPTDNFHPNGDEQRYAFHTTFLDSDTEYKRSVTKLLRDLFSPYFKQILFDYQFLTGSFIIKQPKRGEVAVHRDWRLTDNFNDTNVNFWCPLVDVDETNGTLQMVDGSHKLVSNIEGPYTTPFFNQFSESLKKHSTPIPLKAGEALLYEGSILHWSTPNNSLKPRYVASFMCIPSEARPVFYYPDKSTANKTFKMFKMDGESFDQHVGKDYIDGNIRTQMLAYVENRNRTLSEKEFFELMKKSNETRRGIYFPKEAKKTNTGFSLLNRIRAKLGI